MKNTIWTKFLNGEISIRTDLDFIKNALIIAAEEKVTVSKPVLCGIYFDFKVENNKVVVDLNGDPKGASGSDLLKDKVFLADLKSAVKKMDLEDLVFSGLPVAMNVEDWFNIIEVYGLSGCFDREEIEGELIVVRYDRDIEFIIDKYCDSELYSSYLYIIASTIAEVQSEKKE